MGDRDGKRVVDSDTAGETSWQRPRFLSSLNASMETTFLIAFEVTMNTENASGMKGDKYCIPLTFTLLEG
jgi:hypothetical protein